VEIGLRVSIPGLLLRSRLFKQIVEKILFQAGQKGFSCEAREKSTSGGLIKWYVGARRSSATTQMSLFQQPVKDGPRR
jgi:hypothetical protein